MMKKILSINNYHYRRGGSDVVYLNHAELMEQQGWSNAFFSMHHPQNISSEWSDYFINEIEFGHDYSIFQKLLMASKVIYSFEAQKNLQRLINDFHPNVAHLHCIYHHISPAILPVLKKAGIPIVMTAHDLKIACPAYKMLNSGGICERCNTGSVLNVIKHRCIRESLTASTIVATESGVHRYLNTYRQHIDYVVVPSNFFIEKFVEWGWPRSKLVYIPNYIDASNFDPSFQPGKYFLYYGRLAPEKGIRTLIHAATESKLSLKIVGTGPIETELKNLASQLGGDIEFLGYQTGNSLKDLVKQARAVILPSEWYENAPMSILESYALGKPVIAADIGGISEMVIHGQTGWLFESGNQVELLECLKSCESMDDSKITELGRNGLDLVQKSFNRDQYISSMLTLYKNLGV